MNSPYKTNLTLGILFLTGLFIVFLSGINKSLFLSINSYCALTSPFIWSNLTFLGDTLPACTIMLLFIRKKPDVVWAGLLAGIVAAVISTSLKYFTGILRPSAVFESGLIHITGPVLIHHSFPSGHTVTIFTLAGILIFYSRSLFAGLSLIFLAMLVGISRIAVGVHWPADVLAGASLGIICATIGVFIVTKLGWKRAAMIQISVGTILILADLYLLFYYDCKYPKAIYLQYAFASAVMIAGAREYFFLLKNVLKDSGDLSQFSKRTPG